jgi:hypothetical protein
MRQISDRTADGSTPTGSGEVRAKRPFLAQAREYGLKPIAHGSSGTIVGEAVRQIQQLQQTGMLFMHTQQTQPALAMPDMHSQHAWIMAQHAGSPLVQVMQTPSLVGSHLHMPMVRLQQHIIIPFIIMQQLHMPPAIMEQRFCSIVADIASSHLHVIFMPPAHFSILILHRGTIIQCGAAGMPALVPMVPAPA